MAPLTSSAISAATHLDKIATPLTNASARQGQEARSQSRSRPSSPCCCSIRCCYPILSALSARAERCCSRTRNNPLHSLRCRTARSVLDAGRSSHYDCSSPHTSRNTASGNNSACQCRRSNIRQTAYTTIAASISSSPCRAITSISCSV